MTAIAKVVSIAQGVHQRRRVQGPNAVHLLQALTCFQIVADAGEPLRHLCNRSIECAEFMRQALEQVAKGEREAIVSVFQDARQAVASAGEPLGNHNAILQEQAPDVID